MTALYLGIILFGGSHLFSILFPGARDSLKRKLGEKAWKGLYALVSLAGLVLLIIGYWQSRGGPLAADWVYVPADWARHVTMLFVLLAFILHRRLAWQGLPQEMAAQSDVDRHRAVGGRPSAGQWQAHRRLSVRHVPGGGAGRHRHVGTARQAALDHEPRLRSDIIAVIAGMVLYVIFLFGFHPYVLNLPIVQ